VQILTALCAHPSGYTAYVRGYAYSAGAIIALAAKEIVMDDYSFMGMIDPQQNGALSSYPIFAHLESEDSKHHAKRYQAECYQNYFEQILKNFYDEALHEVIRREFLFKKMPHGYTHSKAACLDFQLPVRSPEEHERQYLE
jgi:ClpP class serine protease